jgi:LL-diaminopimelate aminotransferase
MNGSVSLTIKKRCVMIKINENYLKLETSYLFSEIGKRVSEFQAAHPEKEIIKLGIGDVTRALPQACIDAFHKAVDEMAYDKTFRGYGPGQGYMFLREKIAEHDFKARGIEIGPHEIFISDGAKCDTGNMQEIFSTDIKVAIPDPVYPVYVDTNVMAGRAGDLKQNRYENIIYLESTLKNEFIPDIPSEPVDLIYLCFPNNPTGAVITHESLKNWVDFARENRAIILYDAAYEAFIRDRSLPKSIYEIKGASELAIEFRSFSKTAGFTGTRCAYTVVPEECMAYDSKGEKHSVKALWNRRHTTKFNGVSFPVQKAAEALYTKQGKAQTGELIDYYLNNAALIRKEIEATGLEFTGGENSPYIWVFSNKDSWKMFDTLLNKAGVVCTPGDGFGKCGKGFIRISAFNNFENVQKAMERIKQAL